MLAALPARPQHRYDAVLNYVGKLPPKIIWTAWNQPEIWRGFCWRNIHRFLTFSCVVHPLEENHETANVPSLPGDFQTWWHCGSRLCDRILIPPPPAFKQSYQFTGVAVQSSS